MSVIPPVGRLRWTDVPASLRALLETSLGSPVADAVTPAGGFGHQLAAALTLADGRRFFVKAAPTDDPLTAANLHEGAVLHSLPPGAPAPDRVGIHHAAGWTAVVIAHLDGPHPDLSPASSDPDQIWALLDKLTSSPAPPLYTAAAAATPSGAAGLQGWDQLLADPPGDLEPEVRNRLHELAELEAAWPGLAHGDRIVHGDLRADNMVRDHDRGVTFVKRSGRDVPQPGGARHVLRAFVPSSPCCGRQSPGGSRLTAVPEKGRARFPGQPCPDVLT
ncbi:hypothetical protein OG520_40035 (plasmid) [Streptomyces sp. NBC_00984]|uniref:phosphotransferase n=1 Tax=Streptomyces sp. NBC_00984 TaxID=2903700 RepID=UPI002F90F81A|nr:hypothetical protein OG520_40035 [Streptomyces sp. NBC_00984]